MRSRRISSTAAGLALFLWLAGCSPADQQTAPAVTTTTAAAASAAALQESVTAFLADEPGVVDVIFDWNGQADQVAAGTDPEDGAPVEAGQPYRVGSLSKPFVAVMVLQLVDEGRVDLDLSLDTYLPDTAVGADASIRQLLSHRSGVANYTDNAQFFPDVLADPAHRFTPEEILGYAQEMPGGQIDQFAYSNTNYILLGQLIESLDGTDLNVSLRNRISDRVGLADTVFETAGSAPPDALVTGVSPTLLMGQPADDYTAIASSAWAAGALISTTQDLAAFLHALSAGQLTSPESLSEMTTFGRDGYGLGLLRVSFSLSQVGFGHSGLIPGYSSTMATDPDTGDTLVILTGNDSLVADQLALDILTSQ